VIDPVDVRDLLERPGASREVHVAERIEGLAVELVSVPDPVRADLLLESVVEGILASGPLSGEMAFRCARCLKPARQAFRLEITELFAPGAGEEDDEYPVRDETIDLEPMIRDSVVLAMPFSPLCRPDCLGLCERCGGDRNLGECSCGPEVDPRWAPLAGLKLD
jgi:DUF177 domain-containing protein